MTAALVILACLAAVGLTLWLRRPRPVDPAVVEKERDAVNAADARLREEKKRGAVDVANNPRFDA